jgi:hypothetical protein
LKDGKLIAVDQRIILACINGAPQRCYAFRAPVAQYLLLGESFFPASELFQSLEDSINFSSYSFSQHTKNSKSIFTVSKLSPQKIKTDL